MTGLCSQWLNKGFEGLVPVIPADAVLHETSKVDPKYRGKVPGEFFAGAWDGMGGWTEFEMTPVLAERYDNLKANVGLKMGTRYVAIDVDVTDELLGRAMWDYLLQYGAPIRVGQSPKFLVLFRVKGDPIKRQQFSLRREGVEGRQLFEVMGQTRTGRPSQVVIAGTHPSGSEYRWFSDFRPEDIPEIDEAHLQLLCVQLRQIGAERGWEARANASEEGDGTGSELGAEAADPMLATAVCDLIPNDELEYDGWVRIGLAMRAALGDDLGKDVFYRFSAKAQKFDPDSFDNYWDSLQPNGSLGFGTLVAIARHAHGGRLPGALEDAVAASLSQRRAEAALALMPPPRPVEEPVEPEDQAVHLNQVFDSKGGWVACMSNVEAVLMGHEFWSGKFQKNLMSGQVMVMAPFPDEANRRKGYPRPLNDADYTSVMGWFQRRITHKVGKQMVTEALDAVAERQSYDPLGDYLERLVWDGVPRLDMFLHGYFGVTQGDPMYTAAIGRKWLISAVARAMLPGCKADHALIIEGQQGIGKSHGLAALVPVPDLFGADLPNFHDKAAQEYLQGKWIIEMAELTSMWRSDIESMRSFLTRQTDNFRPAYGRVTVTQERRCVFAGSTNRDDYLKDFAGERRFWICTAGRVDVAAIDRDRDQIWAEAVAAFKAGENWWLDPAMEAVGRHVQISRVEAEPWVEALTPTMEGVTEMSVAKAFALMGIMAERQTPQLRNRMTRTLRALGFVKQGKFTAGPEKDRVRYVRAEQ